jgi:hypothetical protein
MRVYTCNNFTGHYPVGTAAVVAAKDRAQAASRLNAELKKAGLPGDRTAKDLIPFTVAETVRILCDGNY